MNINDNVTFYLTTEGKKQLQRHIQQWNIDYSSENFKMLKDHYNKCIQEDGSYQMQMWEVMNVFGSGIFAGGKSIFKGNKLNVKQ